MKFLLRYLPFTVRLLPLLVTFQESTLVGILLPGTDAAPVPMDHNDPRWNFNYDYNYGQYNPPQQNPHPYNYNPNEADPNQTNPDWLRLRLPSPAPEDFEDPVPTPSHMTPRTRNVVDLIRTRRSRRTQQRSTESSHAAGGSGGHGLPRPSRSHLHETSYATQPDSIPSNYATYQDGGDTESSYSYYGQATGGSSYYPTFDQTGLYPTYEHGGGSSSNPPSYVQPQNTDQLMTAFTQMNVGEIPIQADTSVHHYPIPPSQQYQQHQLDEQEDPQGNFYLLPNRIEKRTEWSHFNPEAPIPLRMLSAVECVAISVARNTRRYEISLWLEDQYLRQRNVVLGSEIPEPQGWQSHELFPRLMAKPPREGCNTKLRETQEYLDILFENAGLFRGPQPRQQASAAQTTARQERSAIPLSPNDEEYQTWSTQHNNILFPLHLMADEDLTRIGLAPGRDKYKVARYLEDQEFEESGQQHLKARKVIKKLPRFQQFPHLLSEQYPQNENSFLHRKQAQVQKWFQDNGWMKRG